MCVVYLRMSFATSDAVLMFSSAPTAPARFVGPCMQDASSWTTPSALGRPPYPTESSVGSSSWIFTPSMTASSVSAPCISMSKAFCTALSPLPLAIAMGLEAQRDCAGSGRGARIGCEIFNAVVAAPPHAGGGRDFRRGKGSGMTGVLPLFCRLSTCYRLLPVELSLVVPAYNERDNLAPLLAEIAAALKQYSRHPIC